MSKCTVYGCGGPQDKKGLCTVHYEEFLQDQKAREQERILREREMLEEIDYSKMVKSTCFSCGRSLSGGIERYYQRGNLCDKCDALAGKHSQTMYTDLIDRIQT